METIWYSIDFYREAICKSKEKAVEIEAEIHSRLVHVYGKILKIKSRAKTSYNMCFYLFESMKPKMFTKYKWYKDCIKSIEEFQKEFVTNENLKLEEEKANILSEIK